MRRDVILSLFRFIVWYCSITVAKKHRLYSSQADGYDLGGRCSEVSLVLQNKLIPHTWRRHQIEAFSVLLVLCAGNSPITNEFPAQMSVTASFEVFFDLRLNKRFSKQSWGWWFEMPSRLAWRHCNDLSMHLSHIPQHTIQNRNVHISVLNGVLWDMGQVHWGICEIGQFYNSLIRRLKPNKMTVCNF